MFGFGAGALWGTPLTDYAGNAIANPTPILFGTLQDVSIDISGDIKELHGENQFPVDAARGKGKIACKAKSARINGLLLNNLFFGQTISSSISSNVHDVTGSVIPATPYQIAPTVPSSGTFARDLGVRNASGNPMVRVASAPITGQYAVAGPVTGATASFATNQMTVTVAGVGNFAVGQVITAAGVTPGTTITALGTGTGGTGTYTLSTTPGTIAAEAVSASEVYQFAAADTGLKVFIDYAYTATNATAKTSTVINAAMGAAPTFRCDLLNTHASGFLSLSLFSCIASKLTIATKLDDFLIPEFDFSGFADASGNVLSYGVSE